MLYLRVFAHTGSRVGQVGAPALAGWVAELYEGNFLKRSQ